MPDDKSHPSMKEFRARLSPIMRDVSEIVAITLLRSIPLIGSSLVMNRKILSRLTTLFESDDEIQRDIDKVVQNMAEVEDTMIRLKTHIERRKDDLQLTLDEYQRFKGLAGVEKQNAEPLLRELRREGNKGILWGLIINALMIGVGILLAHFLRIWFPDFNF